MQQEDFQLSYDLRQAANLIEDAIPYLVITQADIWKHVADIAKYFHWKKKTTHYQIPTILSVDAFFTHEVAVRDHGEVKYVGDATSDKVFIDSEMIRSAPVAVNRSGLGDILSCHIGPFDWNLAANAGLEPKWNEALAMETRKRLGLILDNAAAEIRDVSDKGVTLLTETLNWIDITPEALGVTWENYQKNVGNPDRVC